ncbi:hypothetical protein LOTGIDRAFT_163570 [Lottia gigantea]|uniref:Uncharacterized protein n=1 Tax=Lottia gigantea TaxID=225164 RepID=V4ACL0_LOTGI|nr:hypothetical protein LOTGIDRAFT_163570 [Lottia gigantea]ESO91051.1 hypothetical protein LOTGIDRAFT_163570 [Lottia gigantea]
MRRQHQLNSRKLETSCKVFLLGLKSMSQDKVLFNKHDFQIVIIVGVLGLVNSQSVNIDTSTCTSFNATVKKCTDDYPLSYILDKSTIVLLLDKANFKSRIACFITAYRTCASDEFQSLFASGESYKQAFDEICKDKDNFNATCTYNANSCASISFGGQNLIPPNKYTTFSGHKTFYCGYTKIFKTCLETDTVLSSCPQSQ